MILTQYFFLGGLLLCVQDSAIFEESENDADSDATAHSDTTSNLLSSGIFSFMFQINVFMYNTHIAHHYITFFLFPIVL